MGKRKRQRVQTLKMPDGEKVAFDEQGRVLMSRSSQGMLAVVLTVFGCVALGMPWVLRSQAEARAERFARMRTFSEATCTIKDIAWGEPDPEYGRTRVSVDYQVHVPGQEGTFVASGFSWQGTDVDNGVAASMKRELLLNKRVPCWYDPADPTNAVLVQARGEAPPPMSVWLLLGMSAVGLLFAGAGIATLRTKKRLVLGGSED
ncbi:DUF3592 domain-containing protein [Polyangium mundeleinium]|uniref:DUF3592 domain-containing protein n=1 Tax=Polyangium mundeleinium TaxID=2995306 RepID=A0ABT5ERL1_9BACT|nr:DUF3592 domain-containing protein [Polyangium mundeleinium]MDC0744465.1 DUF3592 domain-containing protein [Polyangium mundeleinium]